jgi:3-hydroxyacyl-CoA dehydrogenase
MRDIVEYPITKDEVLSALEEAAAEIEKAHQYYDLRGYIMRRLFKHVMENFPEFPFPFNKD